MNEKELPPLPNLELGVYEHFKGNRYEVLVIARHSETLEPLVVYKALYGDGAVWVRPYELFVGKINPRTKIGEGAGLPDGSKVERFKKVG